MCECVARVVGGGVGGHNMSLVRKNKKNKQGRIGSGVHAVFFIRTQF